ncbi:MAG TPA: trigger factor [Candidatus Paceibacterota bacterium]
MEYKTNKGKEGLEIEISLDKDELLKYIKDVEVQLIQDLEIDGFRKGKVPVEVGRKYLDPEKVRSLALEYAVERSLAEAARKGGLEVYQANKVEIKENTGESLRFTAVLTLFPQVAFGDIKDLKVEKKKIDVVPKEIDETIEAIRVSRAKFLDSDLPAQEGDRVEIDFDVKKDGQSIEGGTSKNHPLTIGKKAFIPGFEEALVGMKKEEEKKFSLMVPKDYGNKDIAGQKLDCTVTMKDIKKVQLPELDDAFIQGLGRFKNKEQLVLNIEEGIRAEKEEKEKERVRLEVLNKIIQASDFDVPETFIEDQLRQMIENFHQDLHQHGMELSVYLARFGKTEDDLKKEWREDAAKQVKMTFILRQIVKDKGIKVDGSEVEETVNMALQSTVQSGPQPPIDIQHLRASISAKLVNEKALQYLEKEYVS